MAITATDKDRVRQELSSSESATWEKQHVNAALDTLDTEWENNKAALSAAVDTATQALTPPFTFSVAQKNKILKAWLGKRFLRE